MLRDLLIEASQRAVAEPQHAAHWSRVILETLSAMERLENGAAAPTGYLYAGAHNFTARTRRLAVEPLPEDAAQAGVPGVPITTTNSGAVDIRVPFDSFIYAVSGYAIPDFGSGEEPGENAESALLLPTAADGRDLFSVEWGLDGQVTYMTDGHNRLMFPASTCVGSRLVPRMMGWAVRRQQTINVRFRSLINAITTSEIWGGLDDGFPLIAEAGITFHVVNVGAP